MENICVIGVLCATFFCVDNLFSTIGCQGTYYIVHAIHNVCIVVYALPDVWKTWTNFPAIGDSEPNTIALQLCFALHFYHIAYYWQKFRRDDWLHHILMIGIALPIGGLLPSGTLLGYSLFFTTGLPGGIDYMMLFLTRNDLLERNTEKTINSYLQTWIRSPGCVSHATYTLAFLTTHTFSRLEQIGILIVAGLNYWNGQYFMEQVLLDVGARRLREV